MKFGERLKQILAFTGNSQREFAIKINVTETTVSHWAADRKIPNVKNLKAMSKVLNMTMDKIMEGVEPDEIGDKNNGI